MIDNIEKEHVTVNRLLGSQGAVINVFINAYFNCSKEYTKFISIYNNEQLLLLFTGVKLKVNKKLYDVGNAGFLDTLTLTQAKQVFDIVMIKRYELEKSLFDVIDLKKAITELSEWESEVYNFAISHAQTIIALNILNNMSAVDVYKHMQSVGAVYKQVNEQVNNNAEVS